MSARVQKRAADLWLPGDVGELLLRASNSSLSCPSDKQVTSQAGGANIVRREQNNQIVQVAAGAQRSEPQETRPAEPGDKRLRLVNLRQVAKISFGQVVAGVARSQPRRAPSLKQMNLNFKAAEKVARRARARASAAEMLAERSPMAARLQSIVIKSNELIGLVALLALLALPMGPMGKGES